MDDIPVAVARLQLHNIRGFKELDLELGKSALIIGRNGTNKTTLLRALALGLVDESSAAGLLSQPYGSVVRSPGLTSSVSVTVREQHQRREWSRQFVREDRGPELLFSRRTFDHATMGVAHVFAYGAGRGAVGGSSNQRRAADGFNLVAGLFDYRHELDDPELTVRRLQDFMGTSRYEHLQGALIRLLGFRSDADEIVLEQGGGIWLRGPTIGARYR